MKEWLIELIYLKIDVIMCYLRWIHNLETFPLKGKLMLLPTHGHAILASLKKRVPNNAWKGSAYGVFLVRIFPHSDLIRRETEYARNTERNGVCKKYGEKRSMQEIRRETEYARNTERNGVCEKYVEKRSMQEIALFRNKLQNNLFM